MKDENESCDTPRSRLHQLLAVKKDVATRSNEIAGETLRVLGKGHFFYGSKRTYIPFDAEDDHNKEPDENETLSYTVGEKLSWFATEFGRLIDVEYQIDKTNQHAKSDLIVDGKNFGYLPASFLLDLIGLLERVKQIYQHVQVLDPKREWVIAPDFGDGVFQSSEDEVQYRNEKAMKSKILCEATEHHPAQIQNWTENVRIGKYIKKHWSGAVTAAQKAELLGKVDTLIRASRKALSDANERSHDTDKISASLFSWLHEGLPLGGVARSGAKLEVESDSESE